MATKKTTSGFQELKSIVRNKKVMVSILTTLALLILFRIGSVIPMPFATMNPDALSQSSFLQMMNMLGGGGLRRISIFAIGISPYITAQIIIQLLSSDLIPPLSRLSKSGERGRKKIEIITRIFTLPFAVIQAYAIISLASTNTDVITFNLPNGDSLSPFYYFFYILLMTTGTYVAIFLGDVITKKGVGNGITLIILAGIVASLFSSFETVFGTLTSSAGQSQALTSVINFVVYLLFYVILLVAVVFINGSVRKIPIQQTGQGLTSNRDELPYLPLKINAAGVIPVIFASSVMTIPSTIAQFLPADGNGPKWFIDTYLTFNSWSGIAIYAVLIVLFTFFYSYVQINPNKISEDFKKSGRFIPGVKTGLDTEKHISKTLLRINFIGGPFLAIVAALPYVVSVASGNVIPSSAALGGTGIVIMVSASIELWQSIRSASTTSTYNYIKKEIETQVNDDVVDDKENLVQLW